MIMVKCVELLTNKHLNKTASQHLFPEFTKFLPYNDNNQTGSKDDI